MNTINRRQFIKGLVGVGIDAVLGERKPLILCIDGISYTDTINESLRLSRELSELSGCQTKFTYFINTVSLFETIKGGSTLGCSSKQDISKRLELMSKAIEEGHEIGSHTVRHYDGGKNGKNWSKQQWVDELSEFDGHIEKLFFKNGRPYKAVGFRAPYLSYNDAMYEALRELGYQYDTSHAGDFLRMHFGIKVIGVPQYIRDNKCKLLGMDYNWHLAGISNSELERMLKKEIEIKKAVIISMHSQKFYNGGKAYWDTVVEFIKANLHKIKLMSMCEYAAMVL
ncbi:MAG: polysaccharide deacetylase family protein [Candidatus Woesearchaeota archaeon]